MAGTMHLANCDICNADFTVRVMLTRHIKMDHYVSMNTL